MSIIKFNYFLLNYARSQPALWLFSEISHNTKHMHCPLYWSLKNIHAMKVWCAIH